MIGFWRDGDENTGELYASNPWDTGTIAGRQIPGIVECEPSIAWFSEKKKPSGRSGATVTTTGKDPPKFKITIRIWTVEQWEEWLDINASLVPTKDKKQPTPYDFQHPQAQLWGIRSIIILGAEGPKITNGIGTIIYTAQQWLPPTKKSAVKTATWSFARDQKKGAPAAASSPQAPAPAASKYRQLNLALAPSQDTEAAEP